MREDRKLEKRNRILDEAGRLFNERGILATKIIDIANAAGVAKGTVYEYFDSKDDIVYGWAEKMMADMHEEILVEVEKAASAREKLKRYYEINLIQAQRIMFNVRLMMESHCSMSDVAENSGKAVSFSDIPENSPLNLIAENVDAEMKILEDILKYGKNRNEIRADLNIDFAVTFLIGMLPFSIMTKHFSQEGRILENMFNGRFSRWNFDDLLDFIFNGIGNAEAGNTGAAAE